MKKKLLVLVLALIMTLSLTSCETLMTYLPFLNDIMGGDDAAKIPENFDELIAEMEEAMDGVKSYKIDGSADLRLSVSGYDVIGVIKTEEIADASNEQDPYKYQYTRFLMECSELDLLEENEELVVYSDGILYMRYKTDDIDIKNCAPTSYDRFIAWMESENESPDVDFWNCANKEFSHLEDGTWTFRLSGYDQETVDKIFNSYNALDSLDYKVVDMTLYTVLDAEYRVTQAKIGFIFEDKKTSNKVSKAGLQQFDFEFNFSDYDSVTRESVNSKEYNEFDDVLSIKQCEKKFNDIMNSESGSYLVNIKVTDKKSSSDTSVISDESVDLEYGEDYDGYFCNLNITSGAKTQKIKYSGGYISVIQNGQYAGQYYTEKDARALVASCLSYLVFDPYSVIDVTSSNNIYHIDCRPGDEFILEHFGVSNLKLATQGVTLFYLDGEIVDIRMTFKLTLENGEVITINYSIKEKTEA